MQILKIQSNCSNISHKSYFRTIYKPGATQIEANVIHKNNTAFFREDLNIESFLKFISKKFKDIDNVHFFDYACSIGLEAYSLLLGMETFLDKKNAQKFLPILARDYDSEVIKEAKLGKIGLSDSEITKMNFEMQKHFDDNFYPAFPNSIQNIRANEKCYKVSDKFLSYINFDVSDITKSYKNLPKENVVLLIRNCWPYFSRKDQLFLPEKLCNHFEKNAVIAIGSFDFKTQHTKDFLVNGFKKAPVKTNGVVFEK